MQQPSTYRYFQHWIHSAYGARVSQLESRFLHQLLQQQNVTGIVAHFQVADIYNVIAAETCPQQLLLGFRENSSLICQPEMIALAKESVDLVIVPHTLECCDDPQQMLREIERILRPQGVIIVLGLQRWSNHKVRQHIRQAAGKQQDFRYLSAHRVGDWLAMLNFAVDSYRHIGHRELALLHRLVPLTDRIVQQFYGSYAVVAVKRVATMTPLRPIWSDVTLLPVLSGQNVATRSNSK